MVIVMMLPLFCVFMLHPGTAKGTGTDAVIDTEIDIAKLERHDNKRARTQ